MAGIENHLPYNNTLLQCIKYFYEEGASLPEADLDAYLAACKIRATHIQDYSRVAAKLQEGQSYDQKKHIVLVEASIKVPLYVFLDFSNCQRNRFIYRFEPIQNVSDRISERWSLSYIRVLLTAITYATMLMPINQQFQWTKDTLLPSNKQNIVRDIRKNKGAAAAEHYARRTLSSSLLSNHTALDELLIEVTSRTDLLDLLKNNRDATSSIFNTEAFNYFFETGNTEAFINNALTQLAANPDHGYATPQP